MGHPHSLDICDQTQQKGPLLAKRADGGKNSLSGQWQVVNLNEANRVAKLKLLLVL